MIFAHLDHKIRYLKQHAPTELVDRLACLVKDVLTRQPTPPSLTDPMVRILQLDLLYAVWRHRNWLSTPVFPEVLMEFLNSDHKVPRQVCLELAEELSAVIAGAEAPRVDRDRLFLHAIFIACATARDEATLLTDLGLGAGLLRRIKSAAESLVRNPGDQPHAVAFLPEVDGILHDVMTQLADELKVTPWACDLHRLRLALSEGDLEAWGEKPEAFTHKIFQLLLVIGRSGGLIGSRLDEEFLRLFPASGNEAKASLQKLLALLQAQDLVFNDPSVAAGHWQLSASGYELTSEAYACKFLRVSEPNWEQLLPMNVAYQTATLRKIGPQHVTGVMVLLRNSPHRFAPKALTITIERLSKQVTHSEIGALVRPILTRKDSHWLKAAACEGLGLLSDDESVGQLLDELAKSEVSKRVQDAARLGLTRWRHKASVMG